MVGAVLVDEFLVDLPDSEFVAKSFALAVDLSLVVEVTVLRKEVFVVRIEDFGIRLVRIDVAALDLGVEDGIGVRIPTSCCLTRWHCSDL